MRLLLALLLVCGQAWGATWWVSANGSGTADGTSRTNAWAGWTGIVQASVAAGDTVCVDGSLTVAASAGWNKTGSSGNTITIDGRCGGATQGEIVATGVTCPAFQIGNSSNTKYIVVNRMVIRGCTASSGQGIVMFRSAGGGDHNTVQNSTIRDGGYYCVLTQQGTTTLSGNKISGCYDDAIGGTTASTGLLATLNEITYWSTGTTTGDAVFVNNATPGPYTISYNTIIWPEGSTSTKQGIIAGTGSGTAYVLNNTLRGESTVVNHAISVEAGSVDVIGNLCLGWKACVTHFATSGSIVTTMNIRNNIAVDSQYAEWLTISTGTGTFNVFHNAGSNVVNGLVVTTTVAATVNHYNNSYTVTGAGDALYMGAGGTPTYNGNGNNYYPEYSTFIENYTCGGTTYSTIAAYKAACTKEALSKSVLPKYVGGNSPRVAPGFRLRGDSPLVNGGVPQGALLDLRNCPFDVGSPSIGPYSMCAGDPAPTRSAAP